MASDATDTTATDTAETTAPARKAPAPKRAATAKPRTAKRATAAPKRTTARAKTPPRAAARGAQATAKATTEGPAAGSQSPIERAALTSVGAVLVARDSVEKAIADLRSTYSIPAERDARLKAFERRGTTAREALERDVRNARIRFERELRLRGGRLGKVVNTAPPAPDALVRNARAHADLAASRVGTAVETAQLAGATVVAKVGERVASLA